MKAKVDVTEANFESVAHVLNPVLEDEFVLFVKTRRAHWNIICWGFSPRYLFFEDQYTELDDIVDQIAERIRSLGHYPLSTPESMLQMTHFAESTTRGGDSSEFVKELLADHERLIRNIRELIAVSANKYKDINTSDFLTGLLRQHEQMAQMLRIHQ
ncbi:MAG: DNA starvation/stationary phase protection protein [Mucilaginibacter sp.]|uniref:Dps family protein n=1 Tax=Mucilaginibacter sp. TaxID=1882438 RepID=UPI0031A52DD5